MKIGVIGIGMVGEPVARYFEEIKGLKRNESLFLFDTDPKKDFNDDVNQADIVFISVPTPRLESGVADLSFLNSVFEKLAGAKTVVIKSTIPPGTTESFQEKYPAHKILFNPEFLDAKFAWEQFINPRRQIVGSTAQSRDQAEKIMTLLPKAPFELLMSATEAEIVKYASNVHYVRKVNLVSIIASLAEKTGANYDNIRQALAADPRFGDSHLDPDHGGYRGFGGRCLPKDLEAFISSLQSLGLDDASILLESDKSFNEKMLASQGLSEEDVSGHDIDWIRDKIKRNVHRHY